VQSVVRELEDNIQQLLTNLDEEKTSHQDALSASLHLETVLKAA